MDEHADIIKYCSWCGKKLITKFVFNNYSAETGEKLFLKKLVCPSTNIINFLFHDSHVITIGSFGGISALFTEKYVDSLKDKYEKTN